MEKKKILILAGHSGSGKTHLADKLVELGWHKMNQVTTRSRRENESEDAYDFISEDRYEVIKDTLFGKTEVNGCKYGTYQTIYANKPNVVVLNKLGIDDFFKFFSEKELEKMDVVVLGLNIIGKGREGRDIEKEKKDILLVCDYLLTCDDYLEHTDVLEYLEKKRNWKF